MAHLSLAVSNDDPARLARAVDALEDACCEGSLSLDTLCRVHQIVVDLPAGAGGRLRDGPALVRLGGHRPFVPPTAAASRTGATAFAAALCLELCESVPAWLLAANAVAQFTDLHPFADGNGRVARALATWLLVHYGYQPRSELNLGGFLSAVRYDHFWALRNHQANPWPWRRLFLLGIRACFLPPTRDDEAGPVSPLPPHLRFPRGGLVAPVGLPPLSGLAAARG